MTEALDARRRRLHYRSHYTGTKETDLLLGGFAERHLAGLDEGQVADYEHLLSVDDPSLYRWITGQAEPPDEYRTQLLGLIREYVATHADHP